MHINVKVVNIPNKIINTEPGRIKKYMNEIFEGQFKINRSNKYLNTYLTST